ncbi:MAG: hypothetical protein Q4E36_03575, partial [Bacillota bacterium]|nr:hypothetical protein [Bacillota bacterium]
MKKLVSILIVLTILLTSTLSVFALADTGGSFEEPPISLYFNDPQDNQGSSLELSPLSPGDISMQNASYVKRTFTINLKLHGLEGPTFNWNKVHGGQIKVWPAYRDLNNVITYDSANPLIFTIGDFENGLATKSMEVTVPQDYTNVNEFLLVTNFMVPNDSKTAFIYDYSFDLYNTVSTQSHTAPGEGNILLTTTIHEINSPKLTVNWLDPYGKTLNYVYRPDSISETTISVENGSEKVVSPITLESSDKEYNLRELGADSDIFENSIETWTVGLSEAKNDKIILDEKNYKVKTSIADETGILVEMVYEPNVLVPEANSEGVLPAVPDGYVRVSFDAKQPAVGNQGEEGYQPAINGYFDELASNKRYLDVKIGFSYENKEVRSKILTPLPLLDETTIDHTKKFDKWSPDINVELVGSATDGDAKSFTATYTEKPTVIIPDQTTPGETPEGYHRVEFNQGEGSFGADDNKVFFVLDGKTIEDAKNANPALKIPTATPTDERTKAHTGWNVGTNYYAKDLVGYSEGVSDDITFTAVYKAKVVTTDPSDADYIMLTFNANGGNLGTEPNTSTEITQTTVYVLKEITTFAEAKEGITPTRANYNFASWKNSTEATAEVVADDTKFAELTTVYADWTYTGNDVVPQEGEVKPDVPSNFVKVTFLAGENGTLEGQTIYWVNPEKEVTLSAPEVTASTGWKHTGWDQNLTGTFAIATDITATYEELQGVVPGTDEQPKGYVKVTFLAGENGTLEGQTI